MFGNLWIMTSTFCLTVVHPHEFSEPSSIVTRRQVIGETSLIGARSLLRTTRKSPRTSHRVFSVSSDKVERKGCFFGYDVSVDRFLAEEMRGDKVCFSPSRINRKEGGKGFDI